MARIMIVDYAMVARRIIREMLVEAGHEVVGEAATGLKALEKYSALAPDLVTMDITMPEMDGITATKKILADHPQARIIITTTHTGKHLEKAARRAGAAEYLEKPFKSDAMLAAVQKALEAPKTEQPDTAQADGLIDAPATT